MQVNMHRRAFNWRHLCKLNEFFLEPVLVLIAAVRPVSFFWVTNNHQLRIKKICLQTKQKAVSEVSQYNSLLHAQQHVRILAQQEYPNIVNEI